MRIHVTLDQLGHASCRRHSSSAKKEVRAFCFFFILLIFELGDPVTFVLPISRDAAVAGARGGRAPRGRGRGRGRGGPGGPRGRGGR